MMGWGRSFRRWLAPLAGLFALLAFAVLAAGAARADDQAEGKRRWKRGQELYTKGRFLEAATEFEAGYAAAPRPAFLVNIGHSYRRGGDLKKARQAYTKLLDVDPNFPQRAEIEEYIRTIDDALLLPVPEVPAPTRPGATTSGAKAPPRPRPPPAPAPPQPTSEMLAAEVASPEERGQDAITGRAWFWVAAVTVLVAGGVAAALLLKTDPACPADGCFVEMRPK